jgi:glutamate-5-semialdehyde dehydrogenase
MEANQQGPVRRSCVRIERLPPLIACVWTRNAIAAIATGLREIAMLPDPVGEVIDGFTRPGGYRYRKNEYLWAWFFSFTRAGPNVTADAAGICVKSGNAVILRGGKEAIHSSQAIVNILAETAMRCGIPETAVQLVGTTDRAAVGHFLGPSRADRRHLFPEVVKV